MSSKQQSRIKVAPEASRYYEEDGPVQRAPLPMPMIFAGIAALVVVGLLVSIMLTPSKGGAAGAGAANTSGQVEALRIGALAPDFTLPDAYGKGTVQLSSFRGVKPVWVNFWATWCTFCKQEMPEMKALYAQNQAKGLEIIGVDDMEAAANVQQYVEMGGYNWRFVLDGDGQIDRKYQITGLPTHIFIDRTGVIKDIVIGGIQQDKMVSELNTLLIP
jgi:peroxiredoxin